jgi:hypothetical protein
MNKIKFKLTKTDIVELTPAIQQIIVKHPPIDRGDEDTFRMDMIVWLRMVDFYKTIFSRGPVYDRKEYKFTISIDMALSYIDFFDAASFNRSNSVDNTLHRLLEHFKQQTSSKRIYQEIPQMI